MPIRGCGVLTIPSGAPFLPTLSRALLDGVLVDGFPGAGGPPALASATIYVPTQRAASALAEALLAASGGQSVLLPRIAPLGAFEPDDAPTLFEPAREDAPPAGPPPAVRELTRRHTLARLARAWGQALPDHHGGFDGRHPRPRQAHCGDRAQRPGRGRASGPRSESRRSRLGDDRR